MEIDINMALQQASELKGCISNLKMVNKKIIEYQENIRLYWKSDVTFYISDELSGIVKNVQVIINEILLLANDVINAANLIREEERIREELIKSAKDALAVVLELDEEE